MNTLGARLTYLREKRGWTKTYVSKKLGMKTVSTYANWEYDTRQPDNDMIVRIAELFEVPTDYLLGADIATSNNFIDKDEKDIAKRLKQFEAELENSDGLAFNGEPLSDEAKESLKESMELLFRQTQRINKKYTPKKYREDE